MPEGCDVMAGHMLYPVSPQYERIWKLQLDTSDRSMYVIKS